MVAIHGRNACVYLAGSAATASQITEAAEWSLAIDRDYQPAPKFGDSWTTVIAGLLKATGTINGNFDQAANGGQLFDACTQSTHRPLYLYFDASQPTHYYYGFVWPKLNAGMPIGRGTFSMSFEVDGQLAYQ